MTQQKVLYPGAGCVVEFMLGNTPTLAFVLEEQNGKLRLLGQNQRESTLPAARLLPWSGPIRGANLSRQAIASILEEHKVRRAELAKEVNMLEVWDFAQGEMEKASTAWLAGLIWDEPTVDHEAALGQVLLAHKTHFRFAPPEFEIYTAEKVALRIQEAEAQQMRDAIAAVGTAFFQQLWEGYCKGERNVPCKLQPQLAEKLRSILFSRMAAPENSEDENLWKQLCKNLPEHPHLALCLATSWGIVPEHYNDLLDQAHFARGDEWAQAFAADNAQVLKAVEAVVANPALHLEEQGIFTEQPRFISMDPASTNDRDDAFFVETNKQGNTILHIALACPAMCWPYGSPLDKAVLRRATSLYLPEGDEHMLAPAIGWQLFSLAEGKRRPCLLASVTLDETASPIHFSLRAGTLQTAKNLTLQQGEDALAVIKAQQPAQSPPAQTSLHGQAEPDWEQMFGQEETNNQLAEVAPLPANHPATPYVDVLARAFEIAQKLQAKRISNGAVITERPDPEVTIANSGPQTVVQITEGPSLSLAHLVIGEFMIFANQLGAEWSITNAVPLIYRTQDVGIPREYAGIWSTPHEISRVVKALPSASLDLTPRKHAGLGLTAYASYTSPIRRYADLLNQGQIFHFLQNGTPLLQKTELASVFPLISARLDAVSQVQRMRPRYWKLLYFRQQGDKKWWKGVITEEAHAYVAVSLPWAQLFLRGKRNLFSDKLALGQSISLRIGKVNPLLNEIHILETQED